WGHSFIRDSSSFALLKSVLSLSITTAMLAITTTERDRGTGLDYMMARYYSGAHGQFISQDPVFWEIGLTPDGKTALSDPQSQNSYSYARDNPITKSDPLGRDAYSYSLLNATGEVGPTVFGFYGGGTMNVSVTYVNGSNDNDSGFAL